MLVWLDVYKEVSNGKMLCSQEKQKFKYLHLPAYTRVVFGERKNKIS